MIGRLTGQLVAADLDVVTLEVQGVGYEVAVPLGTLGRTNDQGAVTLHIHTVVREDAFLLFGFASLEERSAFRSLLSISNIGPKLALSILGALSVQELARAIAQKDLARLTAIAGVGKKTAERLLLELKDKFVSVGSPPPLRVPDKPVAATPTGNLAMLRSALSQLGFKPHEVERGVLAVGETEGRDFPELVREALGHLAR